MVYLPRKFGATRVSPRHSILPRGCSMFEQYIKINGYEGIPTHFLVFSLSLIGRYMHLLKVFSQVSPALTSVQAGLICFLVQILH